MSDFYKDSFINAIPVWIKNHRLIANYQAGFRCDFYAEEEKKYTLKLTGASYYKVYLNGEFVGYGPARAPLGYVRTDELTLDVKNGINKLAIEVAGYNCASYYTMPIQSFLLAEVYENGKSYKYTGKDFKGLGLDSIRVKRSHRYDTQRAFGEIWNFDNSDEINNWKLSDNLNYMTLYSFDTALKYIPRSVEYPQYNITGFERIDEKGILKHIDIESDKEAMEKINLTGRFLMRISCECDGYHWEELDQNVIKELYGNFIPKDFNETDNVFLDVDEYVIYKMPCINSGFLRNEIKALEDATVFVFFAEYNSGNGMVFKKFSGPINIVAYNLKKSDKPYMLESFEPYSCQYIGIAATKGKVEVCPPEIRELSYPDYQNALFSSECEDLNLIFNSSANTFRQNTVDIYMDCPGRERAGWLCDTYFLSECERFFAGASKVERVYMENYTMAEEFPYIPQGMIPMLYPGCSRKGVFIPQWAMWYVIELYEYAQKRENIDLSVYKELVYDLLSWFLQYENEYGLLENMPGWNFIEWSKANDWIKDVNYPTNMLYSLMLKYISELFGDIKAGEKAERIKNTVIAQSFDGTFFHDHSLRNEKGELILCDDISETCQYYAYFCGFTDSSKKYSKLADIVINICGPHNKDEKFKEKVAPANAFIGNYLRLIILLRMKKYAKAVSDVRGYFKEMAKITGTLWEYNDIERGSLNHGFAAFAGIVICYGLAGISDINHKEKKIFMSREYIPDENFSFELKTKEGTIKISNNNKNKEIIIPEGWKIVNI